MSGEKTWKKWEFQQIENIAKYSTEMMRLKNTTVLTNKRGQKQIRSKRKDQWIQRQGGWILPTGAAKRKRNKKEQR